MGVATGGGRWVLGPTTFEIRWGRTHQIWEWSGPRPYIGGSHPAILPNRDVTRDASGAQNPSSLSLNSWKWPTFNKRWEKSWSAKTLKVYTFWKIDSRALTFSLRLFALGHSLFGNKEEKTPTFRRPQRANQRRAAPPPIDADWIWPWTPADSSRLTAQWTDVVTSDRWLVDSVPSRLPLKWPKSGVFSDFLKKLRDEKMRGRNTAETKICVDEKLPRRKNAKAKNRIDEKMHERKKVQTKIYPDKKFPDENQRDEKLRDGKMRDENLRTKKMWRKMPEEKWSWHAARVREVPRFIF